MPHAVGPPRTIVMVVFDELPLTSLLEPGGRIDASRYPAFAGLAGDGIWYRGATAVHDSTALAVPAMLDGRYPRPGLQSDVYSHPQNLFTLLAGDYELHVSEEATGLCPTSLCVPTPGTTASHLSRGKPGRFRRFVRGVRPTPRPALWFKHVLLPHVPWQYYPSGRSYRASRPSRSRGSTASSVLGALAGEGVLSAAPAAARDGGPAAGPAHGTSARHGAVPRRARDGRRRSRDRVPRRARAADRQARNVQDLAPVPMIVKLPGARRGRVVDRHVETIDVLPTLLELAHEPVPAGVEGRSLFERARRRRASVTVYHRVGTELNTIGGHYTFDPAGWRAAGPPRCDARRRGSGAAADGIRRRCTESARTGARGPAGGRSPARRTREDEASPRTRRSTRRPTFSS